jgi:mono/diheme cytochrome c family protein
MVVMRKRLLPLLLVAAGAMTTGPALAAGDPANGEEIARTHCARCHVIGEFNRLGGIDSTPSFAVLLKMPDGDERFASFYVRRPHPVFVRVPDSPRWSPDPPNAAAFPFTLEDLDDLLAYVETLK